MSKIAKKQGGRLHFDTSSANINCFIRGKSHSTAVESHQTNHSHRSKRKNRKNTEKQIEFQDKAFLESVVSKILNDNDCEGITELIQDMVFPQNNSSETSYGRETPNDEMQHLQISELFNTPVFPSKNSPQKNNINHEISGIYHNYYTNYSSEHYKQDKYQLGTTIHSYTSYTSSPMSPRDYQQANLNLINQMNMIPLNYPYQYYPQPDYRQYPQQRRKRSGEDSNEYKIDLEQIQLDGRTTLMIRHIPNKYTEDMLFQEIGRNHKMKVNFLYLPMDHHNSCNVGYAFVNFIHTKFILDFHEEFNGRRWDKFNSEKICELAYARIQGASSLMDHFQNTQNKNRSKCEDRKGRVAFEFNQCAFQDISRMIITQKEQEEV